MKAPSYKNLSNNIDYIINVITEHFKKSLKRKNIFKKFQVKLNDPWKTLKCHQKNPLVPRWQEITTLCDALDHINLLQKHPCWNGRWLRGIHPLEVCILFFLSYRYIIFVVNVISNFKYKFVNATKIYFVIRNKYSTNLYSIKINLAQFFLNRGYIRLTYHFFLWGDALPYHTWILTN